MAASAAQTRVKEEVERKLENLERVRIRTLQSQAHMCAAKCCENQSASKDAVQQCMNQCFAPLHQVQEYMTKELQNFQNRLGRCAQDCQDRIQDSVDPNTTQSELLKYQTQLDACIDKCCTTNMEVIPKMFERMEKVLSQVQKPSPS